MYYNFVMTERQLMFGSVDTNLPSTPNMFDNNMAANFGDVADSSTYNSMSNPLASAKNSQFSTRPQYAVKAVQCFVKAIQLAEGILVAFFTYLTDSKFRFTSRRHSTLVNDLV